MAVVTHQEIETGIPGIKLFLWETLLNGDTGDPIAVPNYPDKTIQLLGNFSGSANVIIEGSMMETPTYATLNDIHGTALATLTAAIIHSVAENVWKIRPRVSVGDGSTDLDCYMMVFTPARRM